MPVFLYQDYVHNNGVLFRALCDHFGPANVRQCNAADISGGCLEKARLLVVPGGADLFYCEKLNGAGNAAIRSFVENGGSYLGICAGAYYACAALDWAKDEKEPICGSRELAFYKGTATGPVYDFIEDGDFAKSWDGIGSVTWESRQLSLLYSGGPVFAGDPAATVLARYSSLPGQPAAIVECAVGKGRAILCSPHIEFDAEHYKSTLYRHRNPSYKWQTGIAEKLNRDIEQQRELRRAVFERALPVSKLRHAA